jgi:hypothetical protein
MFLVVREPKDQEFSLKKSKFQQILQICLALAWSFLQFQFQFQFQFQSILTKTALKFQFLISKI